MRSTHHITRQELLTAELPTARRFTEGQSARAFRRKGQRGWTTAMPAGGPPRFEVAETMIHVPGATLSHHPAISEVRSADRLRERILQDPRPHEMDLVGHQAIAKYFEAEVLTEEFEVHTAVVINAKKTS